MTQTVGLRQKLRAVCSRGKDLERSEDASRCILPAIASLLVAGRVHGQPRTVYYRSRFPNLTPYSESLSENRGSALPDEVGKSNGEKKLVSGDWKSPVR